MKAPSVRLSENWGEHVRQPKGAGRQLLYLDYDGVLHDEDVYFHRKRGAYFGPLATPGRTLFEWSHLLVELLAPYPNVGIVLSTSWVPMRGFHKAMRRLLPELRSRVVGATFHEVMDVSDFLRIDRGRQVLSDLARRRPSSWVALDDTNEGWDWLRDDRLVLTDERWGLSVPAVHEEVKRLFSLNFTP